MSMKNFIKDFLLEQDENLVTISPDQYLETLESVGGIASRVAMLKPFKGKGIVIDGDLDLRKFKNVGKLTGIVRVKGRLDIANTNVSSLDGITVDGYVSDYNSALYINKLKNIKNQKLAKLSEYRRDGEWNVENGEDESERTEALYDYLIEEGIPDRIEYEDGSENEEDKYFIYPNGSGSYGIGKQYEWIGGDSLSPTYYDVYTTDELDLAALRYVENLVNDVGMDAFRSWVWEDGVDSEKWEEWLIDFYEETVYDDPEGFDVDKELSDEQARQVNQMNNTIANLTKKLEDPNLSDEEKNKIKTKIYGLTNIIEEIVEEPEGDYDDDSIRDTAKSMADEFENNILGFIDHFGFDKKFLMDFVDLKKVTETVVNSDGYGQLLSSSGEEAFESNINDTWYFVIPLE
jgi:hypothetical protein